MAFFIVQNQHPRPAGSRKFASSNGIVAKLNTTLVIGPPPVGVSSRYSRGGIGVTL